MRARVLGAEPPTKKPQKPFVACLFGFSAVSVASCSRRTRTNPTRTHAYACIRHTCNSIALICICACSGSVFGGRCWQEAARCWPSRGAGSRRRRRAVERERERERERQRERQRGSASSPRPALSSLLSCRPRCLAWRRGVFGLEVRLVGSWRGLA